MKPCLAFLAAAVLTLVAGPALAKSKEKVVYSFGATSADGTGPQDGLVADKAGNLYGTTLLGGEFNKGTIFVVGTNGLETVIHNFAGAPNDGENPNAALAIDKKGILYGSTTIGGGANKGIIFQFDPTHGEKVLYHFCSLASCADGTTPVAPLTIGPNGELYGAAELGGLGTVTPNSGVAFRLDPPARKKGAWTQTVLYNFCSLSFCADGKYPYGARLLLKNGTLYGTASQGQQGGTLYAVSAGGGGFQVLHVFTTTGSDGQAPINGVVADKNGTLYGTTRQGGTHGCGTAYSFDPSSFVYQTIYSFCGQTGDASTLYGGLTPAPGRHLLFYGSALAGGANNSGAIYMLAGPKSLGDPWTEKVVYSFCAKTNCADGSTPGFATLLDIDGAFYGTTTGGGAHGAGTLYRYGPP